MVELDLSENHIRDQGAQCIAHMLETHTVKEHDHFRLMSILFITEIATIRFGIQ
jgi:hypothetical protein